MKKIKFDYDRMQSIWDKHGCFEMLQDKYAKQIETEFNWDNILSELSNPDDEMIVDDDFNDCKYASLYICSCLSIVPSGKYYLPFAHGNIENVREALQDECYWKALEDKLDSLGLFTQNGEGDPLDIFFCKFLEE